MGEHDMTYGLVAIVISVFFLIASMDMLDTTIFSTGLASLIAYLLVAIGAYTVAKAK